jgi:hypothetical protein
LIRASLPVQKVAENLQSSIKRWRIAAERYLDRKFGRGRAASFWRVPKQAKILVATTNFAQTAIR